MDKEQVKTLARFGYAVEEIPHRTQPKITLYKEESILRDGKPFKTGNIIECPNLPADPKLLERYLARGLTPQKPTLKVVETETETKVKPKVKSKRRKNK